MADFLQEKRDEIDGRLAELRPAVEEVARLEAAIVALDGVAPSGIAAPARRAPGRGRRGRTRAASSASATKPRAARGASSKPAARRRAGRREGSGKRAAQALSIIRERPGVTIPELAVSMGIKQNYLYRILPALVQEGTVGKDGRGWHPVAAKALA